MVGVPGQQVPPARAAVREEPPPGRQPALETALETPTEPPRSQPAASTTTSMPVRDVRTDQPVRRVLLAVDDVEALGATRTDVGQTGQESWVVLADPEGNEFCVLSPRD